MAIFQYKFEKILSIRECEKQDAYTKYSTSLKHFEEAAENLYRLLKKKEELQDFQMNKMKTGLSVIEIRHHQDFLHNLDKLIEHAQSEVMKTRESMDRLQQVLINKNMEVNKFEKIREKELAAYEENEKRLENKMMDDISVQIFLAEKSR
ncbi:MAG: flagellar export protein FliJ [Bacillus sp. (in: firmicutes)]